MGDTGILLRIQGKLQDALNHFQQALELSNEVGHRSSSAQAMSAIGDVLIEEGDLPGAYRMYQQASTIEHEMGAKNLYASTLTQMGRVLRQQGKADEAQQAYRESLSLEEELGNKSDAAKLAWRWQNWIAIPAKEPRRNNSAGRRSKRFAPTLTRDEESLAQSMLSRALLQQGKVDEARSAIAEAVRLSQKSHDVMVRIPVMLDHAYVMAAGKNLGGAEATAQDALTQSRNLGLFRLQLEASLALGEFQMQEKNLAGPQTARGDRRDARSKGFELIAQKASAAQQDPRRR